MTLNGKLVSGWTFDQNNVLSFKLQLSILIILGKQAHPCWFLCRPSHGDPERQQGVRLDLRPE